VAGDADEKGRCGWPAARTCMTDLICIPHFTDRWGYTPTVCRQDRFPCSAVAGQNVVPRF
jgi:hypothetical protein